RSLSVSCRHVEQVHGLGAVRVPENTRLRERIEDRSDPVDLAGLPELLVVHKKECFVPAAETGKYDRASYAEAVLVEQNSGARRFSCCGVRRKIAVIEPIIRIQPGVAMVLIDAAVKFVRSLACNEFDLGGSHGAALRLRSGGRDRNFLNRIQTR